MTQIGSAWWATAKDGSMYLSPQIDEEILPLTITEDKKILFFEIPEEQRTKENAPHYRMVLVKKEAKNG